MPPRALLPSPLFSSHSISTLDMHLPATYNRSRHTTSRHSFKQHLITLRDPSPHNNTSKSLLPSLLFLFSSLHSTPRPLTPPFLPITCRSPGVPHLLPNLLQSTSSPPYVTSRLIRCFEGEDAEEVECEREGRREGGERGKKRVY